MKTISAQVSNEIFLPHHQVDQNLADFLTQELTFPNPKIAELIKMGYSTWRVPRKIYCYKKLKSGYYLPLGFGPKLRQFITNSGQKLIIDDRRISQKVSPIKHHITLTSAQQLALEKILLQYRCILEAKPGFGKTMIGIATLSARKEKALIIVHTRTLLQQWRKRLIDYCNLENEEIGHIGEGKWQIGTRVTIASYQTLLSRGTHKIKNEFGLVIVDECHHVPANTFAKVVRSLSAKYCLGLTATPFRKDKLDRLMTFYIGKIIPSSSLVVAKEQTLIPQAKIKTILIWRYTDFFVPDWALKEYSELGTLLASDHKRHHLIIKDLTLALQRQGKILVISERVGQAEQLFKLIQHTFPHLKSILVTGQVKKSEREKLWSQIKANHYDLMVATGGVVGEGFDWPALDHLFLTFPFSWRGKLIQYLGRVQRVIPGKKEVYIYDYVDGKIPLFKAMQRKRWQAYQELGVSYSQSD